MHISKKIQTFITIFSLFFGFGLATTVGVANAQSSQAAVCTGIGSVTNSDGSCSGSSGSSSVGSLVSTVVNILSYIVGAVAVIMVIVGGFRYVISGGDSNATNSAKNTILYALVGLAIAALAQVIVHFVLNKVTS